MHTLPELETIRIPMGKKGWYVGWYDNYMLPEYAQILELFTKLFSLWKIIYIGCGLNFSKPFNSHEWPRQNFSSQYRYNINQTSDGNTRERKEVL